MEKDISGLEKKLGIEFSNKDFLYEAITHRSYLNENPSWKVGQNERLEFLGDAVLELIVTDYIYINYPKNTEGEMTNWRSALVNANILSEISDKFDLNEHILLSKGEAKDIGRARHYILANAMEALIGAIYLDQGYDVARAFIERELLPELPKIIEQKGYKDPKSVLQEIAQKNPSEFLEDKTIKEGVTPSYQVIEDWGPDHAKHFKIGVYLGDTLIGEGEAHNKQDAQQKAAYDALMKSANLRQEYEKILEGSVLTKEDK